MADTFLTSLKADAAENENCASGDSMPDDYVLEYESSLHMGTKRKHMSDIDCTTNQLYSRKRLGHRHLSLRNSTLRAFDEASESCGWKQRPHYASSRDIIPVGGFDIKELKQMYEMASALPPLKGLTFDRFKIGWTATWKVGNEVKRKRFSVRMFGFKGAHRRALLLRVSHFPDLPPGYMKCLLTYDPEYFTDVDVGTLGRCDSVDGNETKQSDQDAFGSGGAGCSIPESSQLLSNNDETTIAEPCKPNNIPKNGDFANTPSSKSTTNDTLSNRPSRCIVTTSATSSASSSFVKESVPRIQQVDTLGCQNFVTPGQSLFNVLPQPFLPSHAFTPFPYHGSHSCVPLFANAVSTSFTSECSGAIFNPVVAAICAPVSALSFAARIRNSQIMHQYQQHLLTRQYAYITALRLQCENKGGAYAS